MEAPSGEKVVIASDPKEHLISSYYDQCEINYREEKDGPDYDPHQPGGYSCGRIMIGQRSLLGHNVPLIQASKLSEVSPDMLQVAASARIGGLIVRAMQE